MDSVATAEEGRVSLEDPRAPASPQASASSSSASHCGPFDRVSNRSAQGASRQVETFQIATHGKSDKSERTANPLKTVAKDMIRLKEGVEPLEQFYFMRADAQEVHGLQDWSATQWCEYMKQHPIEARALLRDLLDAAAPIDNFDDGAYAIRTKLGEALTMSQWKLVVEFQNAVLNCEFSEEKEAALHYMSPAVLSNMLFDREFPLGVEESVMRDKYCFAVHHSGLRRVQHRQNVVISIAVYAVMVAGLLSVMIFLFVMMASGPYTLEDTIQDHSESDFGSKIVRRGASRGRVASLLNSMTFSLFINATLDKFGLIDPSTSTVMIGMTLGGTWGFMLDMIFGSDEGFREYLWSTPKGMQFALGCLFSARFGRYIVTIIFDMFFTVILFRRLYSKCVLLAGFTVTGREWIANGFCSVIISMLTFEVYANMTRFQWAYPSGVESVQDPWISGSTMVIATVIMNMLYLSVETRSRVGEPGINDPNIKLCVTGVTFVILVLLINADVVDPSNWAKEATAQNAAWNGSMPLGSPFTNVHLPLLNVCRTQSYALHGFGIFATICLFCLSFVIFVTSAQTLSGLKTACGCTRRALESGILPGSRPKTRVSRNPSFVSTKNEAMPIVELSDMSDRIKGRITLFVMYCMICMIVIITFSFAPLYKADTLKHGIRNDTLWRQACDENDVELLAEMGLS